MLTLALGLVALAAGAYLTVAQKPLLPSARDRYSAAEWRRFGLILIAVGVVNLAIFAVTS